MQIFSDYQMFFSQDDIVERSNPAVALKVEAHGKATGRYRLSFKGEYHTTVREHVLGRNKACLEILKFIDRAVLCGAVVLIKGDTLKNER